MQNRTDSGISRFSTPQSNMDVSSSRHHNKSVQMDEYEIKAYNFFRFLVCSQYFKFSFSYIS